MTAAQHIAAHKAALACLKAAGSVKDEIEAKHGKRIRARRMDTIIPDPFRPGGWSAALGFDYISGQLSRSLERAATYAAPEERAAMEKRAADALKDARDVFDMLDKHDEKTGLPGLLRAIAVGRSLEQEALAALAQIAPESAEARAYLAQAETLTLNAARAALRDAVAS